MRHFLLILFCIPIVLFSQNKRIVSAEGGTSINQSFYPHETLKKDLYGWCQGGIIGYSNTTLNRSTTFSYYSKIGIETPITHKKHFSFSIPFILGYREQRENYSSEIEEVYYGSIIHYSTKTKNYSRIFSFIFGPKATVNFKKWSFFTSVNINTDFFCYGKTITITNNDFGSFKNVSTNDFSYNSSDIMFNLSLQNGILYNVNQRISVGIACDAFFYNVNPDLIKYSKKDNHLFNFGYGTNSAIINTGVRLQYSF